MARRRRSSKRARTHDGAKHMLVKALPWIAGLGSMTQQLTQKDIASSSTFNTLTPGQKAQFVGADMLYRFTGINAAPTVLTNPGPFGINPGGIWNKWTGLGIGGLALSAIIPAKYLPAKGAITKTSKSLLLGGVVGGLFDNPPSQTQYGTSAFNANRTLQTNRGGKGSSSGLSNG